MQLALLLTLAAGASGFSQIARPQSLALVASRVATPALSSRSTVSLHGVDRRSVVPLLAGVAFSSFLPTAAQASGGATAGKYTTIPIAKRRYFGRVKQGVYEFTLLGEAIKKGDLQSSDVTNFFAQTIKTQSARQKSQCAGSGSNCQVKEEFSSRWEDMKLSMYLLGNAFRMDSGKPPEKVKQVKEAKAFFTQVEKLQVASRVGDKKAAAARYADAIDALEIYLNDVELPPTDNPEYQINDMTVPSLCQGSFCI
ncbi:hypothetical protein AB1Y20_001536 [Prymnesium parvum]|uniref:Uncharacterized protein n=1 Tax=Prymnesium parvum TaxID=97485 RepID=A0AB34KCB0_PRYPA